MLVRCISWLLGICVISACLSAQDLTPEMRADISRRIQFQRNWDTKLNSPGAQLLGIETHREKYPGGYIIRYEFQAKGLPTDVDYELLMLSTMANSPEEVQSTGHVSLEGKSGRVLDGPNDPRSVIVPHPAPGEPYRLAVVSKDSKYKASVTLLPNPVEGAANHCRVSIVRLMPNFELAFVRGYEFPPETEITFRGNSEGEVHGGKLKVDKDGYFDTAVLPFKAGKPRGKMEMIFTASGCAPKVSFKWGSTEDGKPYQ